MNSKKIILYSLSTCGYCQAIKKMLDDLEISFQCIQADELPEEERKKIVKELRKVNPKCSFPTVVIDDETVIGYKIQEIKEKIGVRTNEFVDLDFRYGEINDKTATGKIIYIDRFGNIEPARCPEVSN